MFLLTRFQNKIGSDRIEIIENKRLNYILFYIFEMSIFLLGTVYIYRERIKLRNK